MLQEMLDFAFELRALFADGATLREISRYSYEQREAGRNVPFLAVTTFGGNLRDHVQITAYANPTQIELSSFFGELAPGCIGACRYELRATDKGVSFTERTGRGKHPQIDLIEQAQQNLSFGGLICIK